jgi:hypothetical protein
MKAVYLPKSNSEYTMLVINKSTPDDRKFRDDLNALASEESNIQGILMEIDVHALRPNAVDALVAFAFYQSRTKPSAVVAIFTVKAAHAAHDDPSVADSDAAAPRVAEAYQCLGKALATLNRLDETATRFDQVHSRFQRLPEGSDAHCAGECSMDLLRARMAMWRTKRSEAELASLVEEARANLCHDETKRYHVASGLLGFAESLWWKRRDEEALETISTAKALFDELN